MCGIVGMIYKHTNGFDYNHKNMFKELLFLDTLRGEDGTGVYVVNKWGNVQWAKESNTAETFMTSTIMTDHFKDFSINGQIAVGHNRKATKGKVADENSHPFVESNIILVHNGTLTNHKELNKDVEVDSHALTHVIAEHGIREGLRLADGAFALAAYDINKKEFYLIRNSQRPLFFAESDNFFAFASEPWMIYGTCYRHNYKLKKVIEPIKEGELHTFSIRKGGGVDLAVEAIDLTKKKVEVFLPFVVGDAGNDEVAEAEVVFNRKLLPALLTKINNIPKRKGNATAPDAKAASKWTRGDLICFRPDRMEMMEDSTDLAKIVGKHFFYENVSVIATCGKDYTKSEVTNLVAQQELCGIVRLVLHDKEGWTIFCESPSESQPIVSVNGIILNEELMINSQECSQCAQEITDEEDFGASFVRIHKKEPKMRVICPTCVAKNLIANPKWGGLSEADLENNSVQKCEC